MSEKTAKPVSPPIELSLTIGQFCLAEGITAPFYYKLKKQGRGPREMHLGAAVRITYKARLDWQRQQENLSGEQAIAQQQATEKLRKRAVAASKAAAASPMHVSKTRRTA